MGLTVRSVSNTNDLGDIVRQINIANNEMTQDFNTLLQRLADRELEVAELKRTIDSLNNRLGEFSASMEKTKGSVNKKFSAKNLKLGTSQTANVANSTLFEAEDGALKWSNGSGVITTIVP